MWDEQKIRGNVQKVSKNFHQKKNLAVTVHFFIIFFKNHQIAVRSLFFQIGIMEKSSGIWNINFTFYFIQTETEKIWQLWGLLSCPRNDISLRCSVLWNPKKSAIHKWSQENLICLPPYKGHKNQHYFLEFFLKWNGQK